MLNIAETMFNTNDFFFVILNFKKFLFNFVASVNCYINLIWYDLELQLNIEHAMLWKNKNFDSSPIFKCSFGDWYWKKWEYLERLRQEQDYKWKDKTGKITVNDIIGSLQNMYTKVTTDPQEAWEKLRKIGLKIQESRTIKFNVPEKLPSPDSDTSVYSDAFEEIFIPKKIDVFDEALKELKDKILEPATIFIIIAIFSTAIITALLMDFDFCSCDNTTQTNPTQTNPTQTNPTQTNPTQTK